MRCIYERSIFLNMSHIWIAYVSDLQFEIDFYTSSIILDEKQTKYLYMTAF